MILYLSVIVRSILAFIALLLVSRLIGQKFSVISGVSLGAVAALLSLDLRFNTYAGLLALLTWGILGFTVKWVSIRSQSFSNFVNGKATVVIQNGQILEANLKKTQLTATEMMSLLREKNAFKLADVEFGTLEPDGQISVLMKSDSQPITPMTQNLSVENEAPPATVVIDGQVQMQALADSGYDRSWLFEQVCKQGALSFDDVLMAQIDAKGKVYVDLYQDRMQTIPLRNPSKELLLANLKKLQADLEAFALATDINEVKSVYETDAADLQQLIQRVSPYLQSHD
jgi:uncharacterized membrane protein YcaP (DUF421 family)